METGDTTGMTLTCETTTPQSLDLVEPEVSNFFFFWIPIVLFCRSDSARLGVPSCLEDSGEDKKKAHHNLVCRIEPMQARQMDVCM